MEQPTFHHIGVVANLDKHGVPPILDQLVPDLVAAGFDVRIDPDLKDIVSAEVAAIIPEKTDLIIALGGDGTILKYARQYQRTGIPILGIKVGRLGFLTEPFGENTVAQLKAGHFVVQERMRITGRIVEGDRVVEEFTALNDIVLHGAGHSRMIHLVTEVGGRLVREYKADGVILATPTGSTAYSLSAGGPLLEPIMQAIVLAPLSPHQLSVRPIVLDAEESIQVQVREPRGDVRVTIDGQEGFDLLEGQYVRVNRCADPTHLVVPVDYDFFSLLRDKL
jgi:NAD+ kinase